MWFSAVWVYMYHILNICAEAGGNGNGFNMNRKLIYEFFPPPAPRSHANTYRFSLFSTPPSLLPDTTFKFNFENFIFKQLFKTWIRIRIHQICRIRIQWIRIRNTGVADPKLFFSDPDPTCQVIKYPDQTFQVLSNPDPDAFRIKLRILFGSSNICENFCKLSKHYRNFLV